MTFSPARRWLAAALCAAGLTLSACGSAPSQDPAGSADQDVTAGTDEALSSYYEQSPRWRSCEDMGDHRDPGSGVECARIAVPVDYEHPDRGDTFVMLARAASTAGDGKEALLMNPGGPGGSGVDMMASAEFFASKDVQKKYQLVSFDPRGVDRSDGISCLNDRQLDEWRAQPMFDPRKESLDEMRRQFREMGRACHENSSAVVSHMDTQSVARDMDVMRAVLGQRATHYLGFSYGTEIGATYAHLFPQRTGRFVLDGGVDPTLDEREVTLAQAKGFEENLRHFVAECQQNDNQCAVEAADVDAGVHKVRDMLRHVADQEVTVEDGRRVTPTNAIEGVLVPLYSTSGYPKLNSALQEAFDGHFESLMEFSDSNHGRDPSGHYVSNVSEAFTAVNCLDTRSRDVSDDAMTAAARELSRTAPTFGPYLGYADATCQGWPDDPVPALEDYEADTDHPVLVVGTTHDPATPHAWSESLVEHLGNARLVSYDGWGHTAYTSGNDCVHRTVNDYLVEGTDPGDGTRCS